MTKINIVDKLYQIIKDNEETNKIIKEVIQEIINLNKENFIDDSKFMKKFTTIK